MVPAIRLVHTNINMCMFLCLEPYLDRQLCMHHSMCLNLEAYTPQTLMPSDSEHVHYLCCWPSFLLTYSLITLILIAVRFCYRPRSDFWPRFRLLTWYFTACTLPTSAFSWLQVAIIWCFAVHLLLTPAYDLSLLISEFGVSSGHYQLYSCTSDTSTPKIQLPVAEPKHLCPFNVLAGAVLTSGVHDFPSHLTSVSSDSLAKC